MLRSTLWRCWYFSVETPRAPCRLNAALKWTNVEFTRNEWWMTCYKLYFPSCIWITSKTSFAFLHLHFYIYISTFTFLHLLHFYIYISIYTYLHLHFYICISLFILFIFNISTVTYNISTFTLNECWITQLQIHNYRGRLLTPLARKVQLVTRHSSLVNSTFVRFSAALRRQGARGVSTENYQLRHSIEARGDIVLNSNILSLFKTLSSILWILICKPKRRFHKSWNTRKQ